MYMDSEEDEDPEEMDWYDQKQLQWHGPIDPGSHNNYTETKQLEECQRKAAVVCSGIAKTLSQVSQTDKNW